MDSPSWADAKRVFDAALDLPEGERQAYVAAACADRPRLLDEVQSLLTWHRDSTEFLDVPAARVTDLPLESAAAAVGLIGQSVGPWRILDIIGAGGMGVVYRAERADAAFRRQAAIKVVRPGPDAAQIARRFQLERETLAALDHPNIARLMDGGTTATGEPYFVMELVDGVPVDRYCDDHRLTIDARLDLFRAICAGVQYAHEHLVVHRDIKPDNILVAHDGTPKLLDFGVATLVSAGPPPPSRVATVVPPSPAAARPNGGLPAATSRAAAGAKAKRAHAEADDLPALGATWLMTPDYASPEQMSGRPSTIATDVYSLGVLLHVLLTGARPYSLTGTTRAAIEEQLRAFTLIPPSERAVNSPDADARAARRSTTAGKLAKRLAGDLDAIILRALGRTPASRYTSVEQLVQDVSRHRTHHPVLARERSARYVARRFVRRHAAALAVAAGLVLVVAAGVGAVLWEASIAAEARARAERRFNDVRNLAGAFIFDVHDAIADLPGTTPARQLIVRTAIQYLDGLAREASGDAALQRELAGAFVRVGDVQGNPTKANVGDTPGALASYQRAIAIADAMRLGMPGDIGAMRTAALAHRSRGDVLALTGDKAGALADFEESQRLYGTVAAGDSASLNDRTNVGVAYIKLGDLLGNPNFENLDQPERATSEYAKALAWFRDLDKAAPETTSVQRFVGLTLERIGTMHERAERWTDAGGAYQESFEIRRALAVKEPMHTDIQRDLGIAYEKLGNVAGALAGPPAAAPQYREALLVFERLARSDPSNANATRTVAISREKLGAAMRDSGATAEGAELLRAALDAHRLFVTSDGRNTQARCDAARVAESLGDTLARDVTGPGAPAPACAYWRESQQDHAALGDTAIAGCVTPEQVERLALKLKPC